MRRRHPPIVVLLVLLAVLVPAARALATPGDPLVLGDDAVGPPFKAIYRVPPVGAPEKLSPGNAMPGSTAIAVTGTSSLLAVGGQSFFTFNLSTNQVAGKTATGAGALEMRGVALAPDGSVLVTDFGGKGDGTVDGRILRLNTTTGEATVVSEGNLLVNPLGIAVGEDGTVYVTNSDGAGHGSVIKVDPTTGAQQTLASAPLVAPWGIAFLRDGELVVADESYNHAFRGALVRIDPVSGAQKPVLLEELAGPIDGATGVAVDAAGEVVVTERGAGQVDRVNLQTGVAQQIATGIPGPLDVDPEPGVAPTTKVLTGPSGTTRDTTPTFSFEPSIYGAQSFCSIDQDAPAPCRRTFTAGELAIGEHSFTVHSSLFGAQGPEVERGFTVNPNAPDTLIDSGPSDPTNDSTPTFTFEAPGGGTSFICSIDGATAPCTSPLTISPELADGQHTFAVRADNDQVGDSRTFTVDTTRPDTSITSGPNEGAATNVTQPTFTFASTEDPATFRCKLDEIAVACGAVFKPAAELEPGAHILTVGAVDAAGNEDTTPVIRHFTVDTTPPVTTITAGPQGTTGDATPTFEFTASEPGVTFRCSVDGATFAICQSGLPISPALADGDHTFVVKATDPAGNVEANPPERKFTVAASVPETSITAGPSGLTNNPSPTFEFTSTKAKSTFTCTLDGVVNPCQSPLPIGPLGDGEHTFAVFATDDLGHEDESPATRSFTVDTVAPQTTLGTGPGPLTNTRTPKFEFSSEAGATFTCSLDHGAAAACTSPFTAPPLADKEHTLVVTATDAAGNVEETPPKFTFTVDTTPPVTTLTGPSGPTGDSTPTFEFEASEPGVTFRCSLDGATSAICQSPFPVASELPDGPHTFAVRATDLAGNVEETPVTRAFAVDTTPPETAIVGGPNDPTNDNTPTFEFGSTEPGSTFMCSIDGVAATACTSPLTTAELGDGSHSFEVTATDGLGNKDPSAAKRTFTVDTTSPQTSIDAGPEGDTTDRSPLFSFSANETATFKCLLDAGPPVPCNGTFQPSADLAFGPHTFAVLATDTAGNPDPTPAERTFRVIEKTEPPEEEHAPIATKLHLTGTLKRRSLRIQATLTPTASGTLELTITARTGHTKLKRLLQVPLRNGRASKKLLLPRAFPRLTLTARYNGDASHAPSSATKNIRGRR